MKLMIDGKLYVLRQNVANLSPGFSVEQLSELNKAQSSGNLVRAGVGTTIAGSVLYNAGGTTTELTGIGVEAAGATVTAVGIQKAEEMFMTWQSVLAANGVVFKHNSYRGLNVYIKVMLGFIFALVLLDIIFKLFKALNRV